MFALSLIRGIVLVSMALAIPGVAVIICNITSPVIAMGVIAGIQIVGYIAIQYGTRDTIVASIIKIVREYDSREQKVSGELLWVRISQQDLNVTYRQFTEAICHALDRKLVTAVESGTKHPWREGDVYWFTTKK